MRWKMAPLQAGSPHDVESVVGFEVGQQLFLTPIPQEARRGNRGYRQQADTKCSDKNLPGLDVGDNLTT